MTHSNSGKALRVFISYSHDSTVHKTRVGDLAARLRDAGVDVHLDQDTSAPAEAWPQWTKEHIEAADAVLCVFTEAYRSRFDRKAPPGEGRGVKWEAKLLQNLLYRDEGKNRRIVPVVFEAADVQHIPLELENDTRYCVTDAADFEDLCRRLGGSAKTPAPTVAPQDSDSTDLPDSVAAYVQWAKQRYDHLDLIGIDAGDVHVPFDEVYVPLKVASRAGHDGMGLFRGRGGMDGNRESRDIELDEVLRESASKPSLIFGEPGSGKTTALLKLHHLCMQGPKDLGLAPYTVPVFLRLRHFQPVLLEQGLKAFIEHEIRQLSSARINEGISEALWTHRRLLLLFDGLDEIADAGHRAGVLRFLAWTLDGTKYPQVRAVVTCRRVGLPRITDRDKLLQVYEVRPFQDKQIKVLVNQWFHQLAERGRIPSGVAAQRVATILGALKDGNQQLQRMAANPLLLTLLCVVVLLGDEIPRKRVRFYEKCLDILLDRWPRKRGMTAPVELEPALAALGRLAFVLHRHTARDHLPQAKMLVCLKQSFDDLKLAMDFFHWVHQQVGLIVDYTEKTFGFVHLGLQEYLAAQHLISQPDDLDFLKESFDVNWWTEVFLQISSLSERDGLNNLMRRFLQDTDFLERHAILLLQCLRETERPALHAFVDVLEQGSEAQQEAVLRILQRIDHRPPELMRWLENVPPSASDPIKQLVLYLRGESRVAEPMLAVFHGSVEDTKMAGRLVEGLKTRGGGRRAEAFLTSRFLQGADVHTKLAESVWVALLGGDMEGWDDVDDLMELFDQEDWLVVTLPGDPRPTLPAVFEGCEVFHWQLDDDAAVLRWITERMARLGTSEVMEASESLSLSTVVTRGAVKASKGISKPVLVDSVTGMEFLHVPGGRFVMGSDRLFTKEEEEVWRENKWEWLIQAPTPACPVRLSPFWLAKTAVTNDQYARFLEATGHEEPETWRERRFSDEAQPVVNVSWEDAQAYCQWLTETNPDGHRFELPSEAQWEFAARGSESWIYPWGNAAPEDRHACFGLNWNEDGPAAVGSFQDGVGPFGHLDLAGLVWEWCRDAWEEDHSRLAKLKDPLDPVGEADPDLRPVRGGAWDYPAGLLRSAFRYRLRPGSRYGGVGFRVLCAPELDR